MKFSERLKTQEAYEQWLNQQRKTHPDIANEPHLFIVWLETTREGKKTIVQLCNDMELILTHLYGQANHEHCIVCGNNAVWTQEGTNYCEAHKPKQKKIL